MKIGVLLSRVRVEEKLILRALRERGIDHERIDIRDLLFDLGQANLAGYDAVIIRCLSHSNSLYAAKLLDLQGVPTVSPYTVIATCGDKILTSLALAEQGIPTPRTIAAFSKESALAAVADLGYPVVLKPPIGSWGRMLAKVNDREAAEAVIEHKQMLDKQGSTPVYIQAYVDKPGRDIRALVVGDETICAVYRMSSHWITNTARGGQTASLPLTREVDDLCRAAARAVGGGIVAVDVLEQGDGTLVVNEINSTPEFHGAKDATDVDIAAKMVDYVIRVAEKEIEQ